MTYRSTTVKLASTEITTINQNTSFQGSGGRSWQTCEMGRHNDPHCAAPAEAAALRDWTRRAVVVVEDGVDRTGGEQLWVHSTDKRSEDLVGHDLKPDCH